MENISNFENKIIHGNSLEVLKRIPDNSVNLIITSPPYFGCRVYGEETDGLGRESDPRDYIENLYEFTKEYKRILRDDGSLYIIIGDVYFGSKGFSRNKGTWSRKTDGHYKEHKIVKPDGRYLQYKQLLFLPERLAIKMQDYGKWILRADIIWEKPNPIPSHAPDRVLPVHEHILHMVKNPKYYFDYDVISKYQRHRSVIRNGIEPYGEHQATFPESLILPYVMATSREGDIVMDPFGGSGTVGVVAKKNNRKYILIDVVKSFCNLAERRIRDISTDNVKSEKHMVVDGQDTNKANTLFDETEKKEKERSKPERIRKYRKHDNIPYSITCSICKHPKKTNPDHFLTLLGKYGGSKEDFMASYKCRSCRKNK